MPSGYEKSPDYGSPPPSPLYIRLGVLAFLATIGLWLWTKWPAPARACREVPASELQDRDGKALLRIDKLDLKPGECLRIGP